MTNSTSIQTQITHDLEVNLVQACREIQAWHETGILDEGVFLTAANRFKAVNPIHGVRFAQSQVERMALKAIASGQHEEFEATRARLLKCEGMAGCMEAIQDECVAAGVIAADVPPMFYPEVILSIAKERNQLREQVAALKRASEQNRRKNNLDDTVDATNLESGG